jgi:hypothetical protein
VFIVDGLDQMSVPGDFKQKKLLDALRFLAECGPVAVTCRSEIWGAWYTTVPGFTTRAVEEIKAGNVDAVLHQHGVRNAAEAARALLSLPFFLDLALRRAKDWGGLPSTETAFMSRIWNEMTSGGVPSRQTVIEDIGCHWLVESIAKHQVRELKYEIPWDAIEREPGYAQRYEKGLKNLRDGGYLIERPRRGGAGRTIRLRHDLLDCYSMARVLLERQDRVEACDDVCMRSDKDCGWSVLAALAQITHEERNPINSALMRHLFERFLFVLDHKWFNAPMNAKAWAVTHVLQAGLHALLDLILEALQGERIASLDRNDPDHAIATASTLGPPARLTQEAASTLASAFLAGKLQPFADRIVPVLADGLQKWGLRGRFLEGLGLCGTPDAVQALIDYGTRQMQDGDDPNSLEYVARALEPCQNPRARELLWQILSYPFENRGLTEGESAILRRRVEEILNRQVINSVEKLILSEPEIIAGLQVLERNGARVTDWARVEDYANRVRKAVESGARYSDAILFALIGALAHEHSNVRLAAAGALSVFEGTRSRDALLNELVKRHVAADVRNACLEALGFQFRRLDGARQRQAFRYLVIRCIQIVEAAGDVSLAEAIRDWLFDPSFLNGDDWLFTEPALEVLSPGSPSWRELVEIGSVPVDNTVMLQLSALPSLDVGPDLEAKYRLGRVRAGEGRLDITLSPTTWSEGRRFHVALAQNPALFAQVNGAWILPAPLGTQALPGLAVVHVMVLTADKQVLMAKRPSKASYAPSHWSASFEEQVTKADLDEQPVVFARAACRGFMEEFGIHADLVDVQVLSVAMEMPNLNLAVIALIRTPKTLSEIHGCWAGEPRPLHAHEAVEVGGIVADQQKLEEIAQGAPSDFTPLHPTSRLRLGILARCLSPAETSRLSDRSAATVAPVTQ